MRSAQLQHGRGTTGAAGLVLLALALLLAHGVAAAQTTPDQVLAAGRATNDRSMAILAGAFGDFFRNPLAQAGGATTLLGSIFVLFNGVIFVVAVFWGGWGLVRGIAGTAQEGQVLGGKLSPVWMPIRMVTGAVGIVPVFGGFSLSQVVVVLFATMGIGLANLMWIGAINAARDFEALVSPAVGQASASGNFREAGMNLFAMHVCRVAKQAAEVEDPEAAPAPNDRIGSIPVPGAMVAVKFGTENNKDLCGSVVLTKKGAGREQSMFAFRVASVNYDAISARVQQAYAANFDGFASSVGSLADGWYRARMAAKASGAAIPAVPVEEIELAASRYSNSMRLTAEEVSRSPSTRGIADGALNQMAQYGWASAGAWYATFAEVNAAISDAVRTVEIASQPPGARSADGTVAEALRSFETALEAGYDKTLGFSAKNSPFGAMMKEVAQSTGSMDSPTGDWSFGQWLVRKGVGGLAGDGQVNPIIMFKNMGDYMMVTGQAMMVVGSLISPSSGSDRKEGSSQGFTSGLLEKAAKGAGPLGWAASALTGVVAMLPLIALWMIGLGLLMAVYVPMIPFITWMGAMVQYFVVIVEGIAAAPLASLAHMEAEGEGMGQRAERGYIFLLNALARPALMLIGFFAASALLVLFGTFQVVLFGSAIANAQGNSITGLLTILALLTVFLIMNLSAIQGLFNMVFLLPDQVLGYVGAGHTSELGRDLENKVHGMFLNVSRSGRELTAVQPPPKDPKNGRLADRPQFPRDGADNPGRK
ncbi:MAG: hypothetical protein C0423_01825 [Methylibium sp.]|nr:hypothetical protein [Methylibium sp.]